jgi:hypothetical protein
MAHIDTLAVWHRIALKGETGLLDDILAEDVVFHSPVVHTPQAGKALTKMYLAAAYGVFTAGSGVGDKPAADSKKSSPFRYVREVVGLRDAVLEFVAEIDGIVINGVDMIRWNDDGRIVDFKVMVRPLKAINLLHQLMAGMLESLKK